MLDDLQIDCVWILQKRKTSPLGEVFVDDAGVEPATR